MMIRTFVAAGVVQGSLAMLASGQQIRCLSLDPGGKSARSGFEPAVTSDGRFVVFTSGGNGIVPGDTNSAYDVFVRDRVTDVTERVSVASDGSQGNHDSYSGKISDDGRFVVFASDATNLVAGDQNKSTDIFLRDRTLGTTTLVSVDSSGAQGDSFSLQPFISADGAFVAFQSMATNLVSDDGNGTRDIFLRDLAAGTTERVSLSTSGGDPDGISYLPALSADGQQIAFASFATNLVAGDTNKEQDVFVFDRASATTTCMSVSSSGELGNSSSGFVGLAISRDGSLVAFDSFAWNLDSTGGGGDLDVFLRDRNAGTTRCVSVRSDGSDVSQDSYDPSISDDGRYVAFVCEDPTMVDGDVNNRDDVFIHDCTLGTTAFGDQSAAGVLGDGDAREPRIDGDGAILIFSSWAANYTDASDRNGQQDIFANDLNVGNESSWSNYGDGWPGTLGVPTFTASAPPAFGSSLTLDIANSNGFFTIGLLFIGLGQADLPTNLDGTLLVDFRVIEVLVLDPTTTSIPITVPRDDDLAGLSVFLQTVEEDAGATQGFSFTQGLQLTIGR